VGIFTFLFTDIEGSTALLQRVGQAAYGGILSSHHRVIRAALAGHDGREVDTAGDGFFAVFFSTRSCVAAALEMQQQLGAIAWPGGEPVRVRMGMHCGEADEAPTGLIGLDVHRAARVAAVAHGGQVLLSETAAALLTDALPPGTALRDLGKHQLKDLGRPLELFQLCGPGLRIDFPPLRSLGSPELPNNLPGELTAFVGREHELAAIRALVTGSRLVTLAGPGGAGKTRLGLQVAAELLDGSGDGVWLVPLAPVTEEGAVGAAIAEALHIPLPPGRPAMEVLADALAPQDLLIVLDNCEHLIGECAKVVDVLLRSCPKLHVIATSREPLGISGETIYRVPPMSTPDAADIDPATAESFDAIALFETRARTQGVPLALDAEVLPLVVSVCRRLDGMPLAIELAAARLRSMSLDDLDDRLDQRFRLLTGGSRTALPRHQTLRAAVDWSYSLLTAAEQLLLARLSVFAGGFDLAAAEAVCGFGAIDALDVAGLLGSLVDKSLVVAEPAGRSLRYRMLETIRLFAAGQLAELGNTEAGTVATWHCQHYLATVEAIAPHLYGPEQAGWRAQLDADRANVRRAADHAAADVDGTASVLRFGVALWRYWVIRYEGKEAARLLVPVLRRPEASADPALFAEALVAAARTILSADAATSLRLAEQADTAADGLDDDRLLVLARGTLCLACYVAGEVERARSLGQDAVDRARRLSDDLLLGMSLRAYLLTVEPAVSGPLYAEAIDCTERSGDLGTNAALHNNAAIGLLADGNNAAARSHLEAAVRASAASGYTQLTALGLLGSLQRAEHDPDRARQTYTEALRASRRMGDRRTMAGALQGLACLAGDAGDWQRAAELLGASQALLDKTGHRWESSDMLERQQVLDQITAAVGSDDMHRAYSAGQALSFDDAIALAFRAIS
jgi:predicted ATPase/class 3 adenylate cyclase/tetratricopeptide (TPR) repeat protein